MERRRFDYKGKKDFIHTLKNSSKILGYNENLNNLTESINIDGKTAPNRFVSLPMEGQDAIEGAPSDLTFHKYQRIAKGGYGLIWIEACSVNSEGMSNDGQLYLNDKNYKKFEKLNKCIKLSGLESEYKYEPVTILQLNHSGRYSNKNGKVNATIMTHRDKLDIKRGIEKDHELVEDDYLDNLINDYVKAARLAKSAGFDGVDIKACHGYLLSEALGAFDREGKYGGSFKNRTSLLLNIIEAIKTDKDCDGLIIASRINASDSITGYWGVNRFDNSVIDLEEPIKLIDEMTKRGVSLFSITMGNPYYYSYINKPSNLGKDEDGIPPMKSCINLLETAAHLQKIYKNIPFVNVGYSWMKQYGVNVASFDIENGNTQLAGFGRGSIAYSELPNDVLKDEIRPDKACISCNICSQLKANDLIVGCAVREPDIYRKYVKILNGGKNWK